MKFAKSKQGNSKIIQDMGIICGELGKAIPEIKSIILTGSFSRGEGPVKKIGKSFYPYNDYDIQVISLKKLDKDLVDKISIDISKKLGYKGIVNFYPFRKEEQKMTKNFYLDLKCDTPEDLKKLLPRIRTYELRNASMILFGKDYRKIIPDYRLEDLPLAEGAKLLLDRMSQLIEYYSTKGKHDSEFLTYIIQQAYGACCTALLMLRKKYKIGYKTSMEIFKKVYEKDFPKLYNEIPDLAEKIEEFTKWKIDPKKLPNKNVEEEWFRAKENILIVSKYFFSEFLGERIETTGELSKGILGMQKRFYSDYLRAKVKNSFGFDPGKTSLFLLPIVSFILKYKYYQRMKKFGIRDISVLFGKSPDLVIFGAVPLIASAIALSREDKVVLEKAQRLLRRIYPSKGRNWEAISLDYANAYIGFFLQKI